MKKKIRFYCGNAEALLISQQTKKYGFKINMIGCDSYTFEELNIIKNKLIQEGIILEIDIPKKIPQKQETKDYCKCGECLYLNEQYGCTNDTAKVRSKGSKTKLSKGCFWGEKYE